MLLPPLKWDLAWIQEWCNHWCMVLNPDKTKALVVSRSRTANPPHGDLVLSGVSICACMNLDILGVKFDSRHTFEDHVRGIVSSVCQRISILRLVHLSCFVVTMHLFSQSLGIALRCGALLQNAIFRFSSSRCIRWPSFARNQAFLSLCHRRHVDTLCMCTG